MGTAVAAAVLVLLTAPPPNAPLPRDADAIARALTRHTATLHAGIDDWRRTRGAVPAAVELEALYQQRLFISLTGKPTLARAALARLPGKLGREAGETLAARASLVRLTPPSRRPLRSFRTAPAPAAFRLLRWYQEAERRFGVGWHVLAAVNFVESGFGRLRSPSSAGAQGPMQFLPATWRAYGLGGDVHDPHDAILGAANYLRASGAPRDYRRALFAYNRSTLYLDAVLRYANQMKRDVRAYFAFWAWQVYVRTPAGPKRLTGPGLRIVSTRRGERPNRRLGGSAAARALARFGDAEGSDVRHSRPHSSSVPERFEGPRPTRSPLLPWLP